MILTDEEINRIVREAAKGSAIRRDGTTSFRIARDIEQAILEKMGKPYGYICESYLENGNIDRSSFMYLKGSTEIYSEDGYRVTPLYALPEGMKSK